MADPTWHMEFFEMTVELVQTHRFFGLPITNILSDLQNSIWRIQDG